MRKFTLRFLVATFLSLALSSTLLVGDVRAASFSFLGSSGGVGGNYFSDGQAGGQFSSGDRRLTEVRIRSGVFIDAIQLVYEDVIGQKIISPMHGGTGGTLSVFKLAPGEYITRISGKYGWYIDHLLIETNKGKAKGWGGTGGSANYTYTAPPGSSIHGFFGRSGTFIDAIGVILKTP
jgi:jacalin-like lectin domain-containing protein